MAESAAAVLRRVAESKATATEDSKALMCVQEDMDIVLEYLRPRAYDDNMPIRILNAIGRLDGWVR